MAIGFAVWQFVYVGYSRAVNGRTFGMALLGIRVVRAARLRWLARQAETARPGTWTAAPGRSAS